jgi:hypothetical protein|tara:strand:+ start:213 stop:992 length:780 start_codon:yes stop_codon:yes gene_type:complete
MITLLNGETFTPEQLKQQMTNDDFYYSYLGQHALSSSNCKLLLDSPKSFHYITKYGWPESDAFTSGKLVHMIVLEPDRISEIEVVDVQSKNTNKWKDAVKLNRNAVTRKEMSEAERIADSLLRNDIAMSWFEGCQFEVPTIGNIHGLPFRGKADALYLNDSPMIIDLKTTADLKAFKYSAKKYSYDLQAAIYCQLFDVDPSRFIFIAVDKRSLDIGIFTISETFYKSGLDKLKVATDRYKDYFLNRTHDIDSYLITDEL